jgi:hypothetical protein
MTDETKADKAAAETEPAEPEQTETEQEPGGMVLNDRRAARRGVTDRGPVTEIVDGEIREIRREAPTRSAKVERATSRPGETR